MPLVVQLHGEENLFSRNPRGANSGSHFGFIAVRGCCVYVPVTSQQRSLNGLLNLSRLRLRRSQPDTWDLFPSIEKVAFPIRDWIP